MVCINLEARNVEEGKWPYLIHLIKTESDLMSSTLGLVRKVPSVSFRRKNSNLGTENNLWDVPGLLAWQRFQIEGFKAFARGNDDNPMGWRKMAILGEMKRRKRGQTAGPSATAEKWRKSNLEGSPSSQDCRQKRMRKRMNERTFFLHSPD